MLRLLRRFWAGSLFGGVGRLARIVVISFTFRVIVIGSESVGRLYAWVLWLVMSLASGLTLRLRPCCDCMIRLTLLILLG